MAKVFFVLFVLAILSVLIVFPSMTGALNYVPGVKVGDWVKYGRLSVIWTGNGTEPAHYVEEGHITWVKVIVTGVSGPVVTTNSTVHYDNGTELIQSNTEDMTGSSEYASFLIVIASNLKSGDNITIQSNSEQITQITTKTYASASRSVDVINETTTSQGQTSITTYFFDQKTGFLLEQYSRDIYVERDLQAIDTNMWSPDLVGILKSNLIYIIAGTIVIIVVVVATITLRRRKPPLPPPPPTQPVVPSQK